MNEALETELESLYDSNLRAYILDLEELDRRAEAYWELHGDIKARENIVAELIVKLYGGKDEMGL